MRAKAQPARRRLKFLHPDTPVVFLALSWYGPRPLSLVDIIETYDYLNHARLGGRELELTLNTLLAAGLLDAQPGRMFALAPGVCEEFKAFHRRRRKERFDDAKTFIRRHDWEDPPPRTIRLTTADFAASKPVCLQAEG